MSALLSGLSFLPTDRIGKRIEFTEEQLEEMAMMYRYGYSAPEIAEWFGVNHSTIYRWLREMGVEIRHRGGTYIEREIPDPWLNADAAYVFGVLIGDASISSLKKIVLNTPDREFVAIFSDAVESAFGIQASRRPQKSQNHVAVRAYSVDLARSYDRFKWRTEN
ncbi:hypothetical protein AKJ66_00150 [candidate division MSBL1 archaeon SCGC-AAA259E22]|uniref:Resolvase HTH domain-containing protein n=1 Tax=candidate division MSBL1 archaeon SCGC-AAA259E22 TaxID=1698265 RepID=A0A133UID6_9EURY|nr:hypothetical protein AKJ66_00150 [candidate division MSBL1 archaeon SCGC-AAA259E22]